MLFEFILVQKFAKQFVIAFVESNAMIERQSRRVDLPMQFDDVLGFVEFVAESFHCIHLQHQNNVRLMSP